MSQPADYGCDAQLGCSASPRRTRSPRSATVYAVAPEVVEDKFGRVGFLSFPDGASATSTLTPPAKEQECGDVTSDGG